MKKWLIAVVVLLLLVVLGFAMWGARSRPNYLRQFHVLVLAVHPGTNSSALLDVIITNGTSVPLAIVDDSAGNPAFLVRPASDAGWSGAKPPINIIRVIEAGASLTNSVVLTNPPARFRLACTLRNLDSERQIERVARFLPRSLAARYAEFRRRDWDLPFQYSDWVDLPAATNAISMEH
jgi:hypothetical protein